jgi:hypothetical protein
LNFASRSSLPFNPNGKTGRGGIELAGLTSMVGLTSMWSWLEFPIPAQQRLAATFLFRRGVVVCFCNRFRSGRCSLSRSHFTGHVTAIWPCDFENEQPFW